MRNVCFLFGINGVGKTTLAGEISAAIPGTVVINGSEKLRQALGGLTRAQLEGLQPEDKLRAMRVVLLEAFKTFRHAPLVLCDSHLTVPIRKDGVLLRYERMWDSSYERYAKAFVLITAPIERILHRRREDTENGVRTRDADPTAISTDLEVIQQDFLSKFSTHQNAFSVINDGPKNEVAQAIIRQIPH
jgi:adenylate kinase